MTTTYLTTEELAERIKFDPRSIRNRMKDAVLIEGIHWIRPFGRRRILWLWEAIEADMVKFSQGASHIPMAGGGVGHG